MRAMLGLMCLGLVLPALAQDRSVEIDPNTKIQGGADVRGSGANAGAGAHSDNNARDNKVENEPRIGERGNVAGPDNRALEADKPISERKPQERDRDEDAAKGATKPAQ